jgi:hypothetical protein
MLQLFVPTSPCVSTIQQQGKQIVRWPNVKLGGFDQAKHNTYVISRFTIWNLLTSPF